MKWHTADRYTVGLSSLLTYSALILFLIAFCVLAGAVVAVELYILLPIFMLPLLLTVLPISNRYQSKLFYILGASLLIAALLWPRYSYIRVGGLPGITPTRVLLAISLFVAIVYFLRSPKFKKEIFSAISQGQSIFWFVAIFIVFRFLSVVFAHRPLESLYGFLNEILFYPLMMLLFVTAFRSSIDVERIVRSLVYVTLFICLIGTLEYIRHQNVFTGILPVTDEYAQEALLSKVRDSGYRIQSTFDHPLTYAQFLVCVIPILIAAFFRFNGLVFRSIAIITVILAFGSVWLTGSRSGMVLGVATVLGMGVIVSVVQFLRRRVRLGALVISMFGLAIVSMATMLLIDSLMAIIAGRSYAEASSTSARLLMLDRAIPLLIASPLVGHGVNQAAALIGFVGSRGILTVDSLLISFLVESGVIALLAYVVSIFSAIIFAVRNAANDSRGDILLHSAFAASLLVFFMTTVTLSLTSNMFLLAFLFAAVVSSRKRVVVK